MAAAWGVFGRVVHAVNRVFTVLAGALSLFILCVILYDVTLRYVFDAPTIWAIDFSSFALSYLFFLALAPALEGGFHVSVDFFSQRFPPRLRRIAALVAAALAIGFVAVLFWELLQATIEEFVVNDLTPTAVPVRVKWLYLVGPIGAFQMLLTAIFLAGEQIRGVEPPRPADAVMLSREG